MSYIHDTKKAFIDYFLKNYQLSQRESIWILNLVKKHDFLLKKIKFVDSCSYGKIGVSMKTIGSSGFDISFYTNGNFVTSSPSEIFMFFESLCLSENPFIIDTIEEIHIQLNFSKKNSDVEYLSIKDNGHVAPLSKRFSLSKNVPENKKIFSFIAVPELEIDLFLAKLLKEHSFFNYNKRINDALDSKDEKLFFEIINEINNLNLPIDDILKSEKEI